MADSDSVPFWWIILFVLLALGAGIGAIAAVGGSIILAPIFTI